MKTAVIYCAIAVGCAVTAISPMTTSVGAVDFAAPDNTSSSPERLAEFPRTIDDIPSDFVFLAKAGPEDRSRPLETPPEQTEKVGQSAGFRAKPSYVVSSVITAGTCKYRQNSDNIHTTTSTGTTDASVHGWWTKESVSGNTCPSKAIVTIYLQAYGCGSFTGCGWVTLASGQRTVYAGGGSTNWANARRTCANTNSVVVYREQVDVDLVNWSDPSGYSQGADKQLWCYPT